MKGIRRNEVVVMQMEEKSISQIATEYLTRILNSKNKELEIQKVVLLAKLDFPNQSEEILNLIKSQLINLSHQSRKVPQKRSFEIAQQANDDFLEYIELLNKALESKGK